MNKFNNPLISLKKMVYKRHMKALFLGILDVVSVNLAYISFLLLVNLTSLGKIIEYFSIEEFQRYQLVTSCLVLVLFNYYELYAHKRNLFDADEFMYMGRGLLFILLIILTTTFLHKSGIHYSGYIFTFIIILSYLYCTIGRIFVSIIVRKFREKGFDQQRVIILGCKETALKIHDKLLKHKEWGYQFIGFITDKNCEGKNVLGNFKDLDKIFEKEKPTTVFITTDSLENKHLIKLIMTYPKIEFKVVPAMIEALIKAPDYTELKDTPLVVIHPSGFKESNVPKRIFDIIVSSLIILITSPILIFTYITLLFTIKSPLFIQKRIGKNGKTFNVIKFRSMKMGSDKAKSKFKKLNEEKGVFKIKNDPRITRFGKFIRRTCIDELPQVFNVFMGDMSIVGPRPHVKNEVKEFTDWQLMRLKVRPGMTGLWQVTGRHELDFNRSMALDIYYIKNMSILLDIEIIIRTIPAIILNRGIW